MNNIAIIGAGPAGVLAAILIAESKKFKVSIFDFKAPLSTLLPTGGGRCNLTYYEYDNNELVKNYPRGDKFLLSVFHRFNPIDTIKLFEDLGIKTYVQNDMRIFPESDSSKDVANRLLKAAKDSGVNFITEKVEDVELLNDKFKIYTNNDTYIFDKCIFAAGGKSNSFEIIKNLGHTIAPIKPSLAALVPLNNVFNEISGIAFEDVSINAYFERKKIASATGGMIFTHKALSGPALFKISALCAYQNFSTDNPLTLKINFLHKTFDELEIFIEKALNEHPNKTVFNTFAKLIPSRLLGVILDIINIDKNKQIVHLNKHEKSSLLKNIGELQIDISSILKDDEIVTAGGVSLDEIDSKSMQSKLIEGLYFIGEIINIDGFTGGFNLQNCWSTAFIAAEHIKKTSK